MAILRADFDGTVAALGFPSEKERKVIESKVAQVAEACDNGYIYLPLIAALYAAMLDISEAKGETGRNIFLEEFIAYLGTHEHAQGFGVELVYVGALETHMPVGENYYTEQENVYRLSDDEDRTFGYVRICEEKFYETVQGELETVCLYINAL